MSKKVAVKKQSDGLKAKIQLDMRKKMREEKKNQLEKNWKKTLNSFLKWSN